ncbi:MAG: hypothetical protein CVU09_02790 [Bacteroidetes bacterium HGW-Bacteroidetes-4]|jgi:hypothetical protein|nr:MAG: hypothetical protein CVU09_02790 [Bacteroidetes bacterium HGW-Bacteroidetes-4]
MKKWVLIFLLYSTFHSLHAQGDISEEKKEFIRNERTFHLMLNSNGWGGGFMYGKMKNIYRKQLWNVEFVSIKDPKEYRVSHPYYPDLRRFVFGKANEMYNFRFGLGQQFNLFDKKDRGGIEVRLFYHTGLSVGVLKPLYYITSESPRVEEKFDPAIHSPYDILGGASFFKGFNELNVTPGVYLKAGSGFEFSQREKFLNVIEGGVGLDVFPKKMKIMANDQENFLFFSLFIVYRFGKIINPRAKMVNNIGQTKSDKKSK